MHPCLGDPDAAIAAGEVFVDGRIVTNPRSLVRVGAAIAVRTRRPLRGEAKLEAALAAFRLPVAGRVALDCGAAAGGFTRVLLGRGAVRVYAVDAGYGQLLGSLRQDPRVVNLERVNLAELDRAHVPDVVELVTLDLSYLSVAGAVPQLERLRLAGAADLVALVKPMFELGLPEPPQAGTLFDDALRRAVAGIERAPWRVTASLRSPVTGSRGAAELFVHAQRR
jgi:23S rRNA (cytidine1920-2'-O)/16S rRNA (cytidine1409-2'-O)-methyltransferase